MELVYIYCNLHKKCWSIKSRKTGKVIAHTDHAVLQNARFTVSESGRQRVLRERRKNVHAGVIGEWVQDPSADTLAAQARTGRAITYDPYKNTTFITRQDQTPVYTGQAVSFDTPKNVWVHG